MTDYRMILLYYSKGNNNAHTARICQCSRPTVISTIKRAKEIGLEIPVSEKITDKQLQDMLFPSRSAKEEYETPDFVWEKKMLGKKHISLNTAWRRYYKRCLASGKKPYERTQFIKLMDEYLSPTEAVHKTDVIETYNAFVIAQSMCGGSQSEAYQKIEREKQEWLKKMQLVGAKF